MSNIVLYYFLMPQGSAVAGTVPLCVDLDGTLADSDQGLAALMRFIKKGPWRLFMPFLWYLSGGRALAKRRLAERTPIDPSRLSYREDFLEFLRRESGLGRNLVLATGADEIYARAVARHLGIFSRVLASDGRVNLIGEAKRAALVALFGEKGFDYAGDSWVDIPVWRSSRAAILVRPERSLERRVRSFQIPVARVF